MNNRWLAALLAALMLLLVGCAPLDLSTLGNHVTGGETEEIIVYEADNAGQALEIAGPDPVEPIDG